MTTLDIIESLCLAVAAGNLADARELAAIASQRLPAHRAAQVDQALCRVPIVEIVRAVCRHYGITIEEIRGPERVAVIARPRAVAMFLAREMTDASYQWIGSFFGGRDHSTAIDACKKVCRWIAKDGRMARDVALLRDTLGWKEAA